MKSRIDIGAVLKRLRLSMNLTQTDLSEAVGGAINDSTISKMETKNLAISPDYLVILANFFGISVADIIREAEGGGMADPTIVNARHIPALHWSDLNNWKDANKRMLLMQNRPLVVALPPISAEGFSLTAQGDSMLSTGGDSFAAGMTLHVDPQVKANDRDYVIALDSNSPGMFRQLVIEGSDHYLKPLNRDYRATLITPDTTIIGKVIRAIWNEPTEKHTI
jgi:SOS-response transcriptional repressor LexA